MLNYEEGKKVVFKGLILLAVVTLIEVAIALIGNGHIIEGMHWPKWIMYPLMISLSLYKAYFIVYEFMHMRYEVRGLSLSVLMPTILLVWGLIAFANEGMHWNTSRAQIKAKNSIGLKSEGQSSKSSSEVHSSEVPATEAPATH